MRHAAPSHTGQSGEEARSGGVIASPNWRQAWGGDRRLDSGFGGDRRIHTAGGSGGCPAWASNTNEIATVIVAEVYAILIIALVGFLGGAKNAFRALRFVLFPHAPS